MAWSTGLEAATLVETDNSFAAIASRRDTGEQPSIYQIPKSAREPGRCEPVGSIRAATVIHEFSVVHRRRAGGFARTAIQAFIKVDEENP